MAGSTFGTLFRLTTFGESHGTAIGGVIDGVPSNIQIDLGKIQMELDRRKPGQSAIVTQRKESDTVQFLSGIFEGKTTGAPIGFVIPNEDQESEDYEHLKDVYRPSQIFRQQRPSRPIHGRPQGMDQARFRRRRVLAGRQPAAQCRRRDRGAQHVAAGPAGQGERRSVRG